MAVTVAQLTAKISIDGASKAKADLSDVSSKVDSTAGSIRSFATGAAILAGTALIGIGVATTKMAADFQSGMTSLVTGAGESEANIKKVSDGILSMAPSVGTTTKALTDGMYMIESAGFHGADGLNVLKMAAEGAKVGNADLKDVANGVTTALTDYHLTALDATTVTNDLVATVASGKTTMGSLASSLKSILPVASSAGISLRDVSGAMATMTGEGVPAGQAANYLKTTILALEAPGTKGAKALKSIGLSSQEVATAMKQSLPSALQMITDHLKTKFPEGSAAYTAALKAMMGGSSALSTMLDLTGSHMSTFKDNVKNISDAVNNGGHDVNGWAKVQGNFNFQMDQAREVVETLGIKLGTALLPKVGELLAKIMPAITSFGDWLIKSHALENAFDVLSGAISGVISVVSTVVTFFQQHQAALEVLRNVMIVVAGAILGLVVFAFWTWATAAAAAAIATLAAAWPFILIGAIIAAVVGGIILAIQHWGDITKWFQGMWASVSSWFMGILRVIGNFFVGLWTGMANFFVGVWNGIVKGLQTAWNFIVNVIKIGALLALAVLFAPIVIMAGLFIWLYQHNRYFKMLVDAIVGFFVGCFNWLRQAWTDVSNWLVGAWNDLVGFTTTLWGQISGAIRIGFFAAIGFVVGVWNYISGVFTSAWNTYIAGPLRSLWTTVSAFFSNVWTTYIAGPIGGLWNSLSTTISGWANSALTWGENLIQGFINGIKNKIGQIGSALADTAKKIADFLGFHSPTKEGPGSEADMWAPNFVKMYAAGLKAGMPQIQDAVSNLIKPVSIGLGGNFSGGLSSGSSGAVIPTSLASSAQAPVIHIHNHNYIDGKEMTDNTANRLIKNARTTGPIRSALT